jgi:hypothetical protein
LVLPINATTLSIVKEFPPISGLKLEFTPQFQGQELLTLVLEGFVGAGLEPAGLEPAGKKEGISKGSRL